MSCLLFGVSGRGQGLVECFINVPQANAAAGMLPKLEGELTRKHSAKPFPQTDAPQSSALENALYVIG